MKASDLVSDWSVPNNSRLTTKQYSFRLPIDVAAKLAALEDLYPTKSRTQLVGDLLSTAIDEVEKNLPSFAGARVGEHPETNEPIFEESGPIAKYRILANKHYLEIEKDLGNENSEKLFSGDYYVSADGK